MRTYEELEELVLAWGGARGILEKSTPQAQLLKTMSELGELADATVKGDTAGVIDGIGDTMVTLILYSEMTGVSLVRCLEAAYDEIKGRKGSMSAGGVFVKEA
jgi:NTP pyrophosphatase (non-canonical NTP hydrolase)